MRMRALIAPLSWREAALLSAALAVAGWMIHSLWTSDLGDAPPMNQAVAGLLGRTQECHCGTPALRALGTHAHRAEASPALLPVGLRPDHFRLFQQRHCQGYVDWWNVDEGLLRSAAAMGDAALLCAMGRMRRSAQSVLLGDVHQRLVLGTPQQRAAASPTLQRLTEAAGSEDLLLAALHAGLPPAQGWLVLGVDLATGEMRLAHPDAEATEGLWGAVPVIALDFHRTAHLFDFGDDRAAYLDTLWPQINRAALEERAAVARHLLGREFRITESALRPLSEDDLSRRNEAALAGVRALARALPRALAGLSSPEDQVASAVPPALAEALSQRLGEQWRTVLPRWVALAPRFAVMGVVMETSQLALFHVADPAREGVWGVVPIAAFTPDQAEALAAVDWEGIARRWERWRAAAG